MEHAMEVDLALERSVARGELVRHFEESRSLWSRIKRGFLFYVDILLYAASPVHVGIEVMETPKWGTMSTWQHGPSKMCADVDGVEHPIYFMRYHHSIGCGYNVEHLENTRLHVLQSRYR
jgi:hypothetical protein